jgi:uncharacterized protein (DUF1330 family)
MSYCARDYTLAQYRSKLEVAMSAYVVVDIEVLDREKYERYKQLSTAALTAHGGRFIVRGGNVEILEGTWSPKRLVIIEFPSVERARAWWDSPEYAEGKALRQATARSQLIIVEGV